MRRQKTSVILLLFLFISTNGDIFEKPRECCQYSQSTSPGTSTQTSCPSQSSCSIKSQGSNISHPDLEECKVMSDSKTPSVKSEAMDRQCWRQDFTSNELGNQSLEILNHLMVNAYLLEDKASFSNMEIFGLEIGIPYDFSWTKARFRLTNNEDCQESCSPRCVEIERKSASVTQATSGIYLLYDCELGIYHTSSKITVPTSGHSYGLDVCIDNACQSYLMTMPESSKNDSKIILIETRPLITDGDLVMHFPPSFDKTNVSIRIESIYDPEDNFDVIDAEIQDNGLFTMSLGMNLDPGTPYRILYSKDGSESGWNTVARFQTGHRTKVATGVVLFLMFLFITLLGALIVWKRYNQVMKKNQVNPTRLLESGRIKARNVLIISNVDNRHHIDIVLSLGKYLKSHCAVGEVYFALDPHTGITSQTDHDPWKWAQETSEKISQEKNGFLVFIAGPPPEMGLAIYKDLPNNQAFVGAAYLQSMANENRVAVLHLPYSDPETVPKILPTHIRNDPYILPKDTNSFLCQLLEVKMRELFPCIPYPMVKPRVLPHELQMYKGGRELLTCIEDMTTKVSTFRAEQRQALADAATNNGGAGAGSIINTLQRTEDTVPPAAASEIKGLLSSPLKSPKGDHQEEGIKVTIENGILSLNDKKFQQRDTSINPDLD